MNDTRSLGNQAKLPDGSDFEFWEIDSKFERVIHVDCNHKHASDHNNGSEEKPFATIGAAAKIASPGTQVIIHEGIYRETVQPERGGTGPDRMISYEGKQGDQVIVRASVEVDEFHPSEDWTLNSPGRNRKFVSRENVKIWQMNINPDDFKGYNPFCSANIIHDRLFLEYGKTDMTSYLNRRGMVFIDGKPMKQVPLYYQLGENDDSYWVEANGQKIHVRLKNDEDPSNHSVEITNREQCISPKKPFLSYIRIKNIIAEHAAMGAPVPQRGSISCYRGHHWIIEDCTINWANAVAIDCGNECWHHPLLEDQIHGFSIIRRNTIRDAGVCSIAGLRTKNMLIEDNKISNTGWQRMELSWEAGGIKLHHAINALIRRNIIENSLGCDSIWLDVGNENCRITSNLLINGIDSREHIFMECNRDAVNLIDNNIIWQVDGRFDKNKMTEEAGSSGWYKNSELGNSNGYGIYLEGTDRLHVINNLIGNCENSGFFAKIVAFRIRRRGGTSRKNRIMNNIFYNCGEAAIKLPNEHNAVDRNVYSKMPGGFLRLQYPEPTMCLDLPTWQEFCNFDENGVMSDISFDINPEDYTMVISQGSILGKVMTEQNAMSDYFGDSVSENRLPGPFSNLKFDFSISIDPRKFDG